MFKYKLTVSDLEFEYMNVILKSMRSRAKRDEDAYLYYFSGVWEDLLEEFECDYLDSVVRDVASIHFRDSRIRDLEILAKLDTYTTFNLFTESYIFCGSEIEINTSLFIKYLEDFFNKKGLKCRKIKLVLEEEQ